MSQMLSQPQRIPGTLPLFFTALAQSPRRIFWQEMPENLSCRLVFGIPQADGTLSPLWSSEAQTANVWNLPCLSLQSDTLYGWQIETTEDSAPYELVEGRFVLLSQEDKSEVARHLQEADAAETNPMALLGMVALLCHFGLFQEALRLTTRSLAHQPLPARKLMQDTARLMIYRAMVKQIAAGEGRIPARFGEWAAQMIALYAARVEQRKHALSNAAQNIRANKAGF